jgi:2-C-methyl-D-erythritol 2,4-cyclodiphosphate synthase
VTRVGVGVDAHAFGDGRALVLGGVAIEGARGLAGHSDGDVVCHAIADALLGAAGVSDLGTMFPNDDRWLGASGLALLGEVARALSERGWSIGNVDVTVVAEAPRLSPHRDAMVVAIARALGAPHESVWVKATTTDALGFTGRGEGIAAIATASVQEV